MKRFVSMMMLALWVAMGHMSAQEARELTREEKKPCKNVLTVCCM